MDKKILKKIVVVGLDGANWELIKPWIQEGQLPNLSFLLEHGSWGISKSQLPPVTCPSWRCYSTGKNSGKLGVFWWCRIDKDKRSLIYADSHSFQGYDYFDYLSDDGIKVGVFNMPMTYPPKKLSGFMVSGPPDGREKNFTEPPSLSKKLKRMGYQMRPVYMMIDKSQNKNEIKERLKIIEKKLEIALELEREVDFFHFSIFYINVLQHFFYNEEPTKKAWKIVDQALGELIRRKRRIIIMSDHGIAPISAIFYINQWLLEQGYLKLKSKYVHKRRFLTKSNLALIIRSYAIKKLIKKIIPASILNRIPDESIPVESVDWERSQAIATGQGEIYLTKKRTDRDYIKIRERLINDLKKLKNPITNNFVAKEIFTPEQIYSGPFLNMAPDIIFDQADDIYTVGPLGNGKIFTPPKRWKAENIREGIFLAYGKEIKTQKLKTISILDIAPTIMHWLGEKIPNDMDGKVLKEIFKQESEPAIREPSYRKPKQTIYETKQIDKEQEKEIEQRLKDLGYLH